MNQLHPEKDEAFETAKRNLANSEVQFRKAKEAHELVKAVYFYEARKKKSRDKGRAARADVMPREPVPKNLVENFIKEHSDHA